MLFSKESSKEEYYRCNEVDSFIEEIEKKVSLGCRGIIKLEAENKKLRDALEEISFAKIDTIEKEDMELFASELIDIAHDTLKDGE